MFNSCFYFIDIMNSMEEKSNELKSADLHIQPSLGIVSSKKHSIRLSPIHMKVLLLLIQNENKVVARNDILDEVWKNQIIADDNLTKCISDIRSKLKEIGVSGQWIKTVPKKGYIWQPKLIDKKVVSQIKRSESIFNNKIFNSLVLFLGVLSLFFVIWATSFLIKNFKKQSLIPILLISNTVKNDSQNELDVLLKESILKTQNIRFLSNTIAELHQPNFDNDLLSFSERFNVNWSIDSEITKQGDYRLVTLSLINVKTAMEYYSDSQRFSEVDELNEFCLNFLNQAEEIITGKSI